MLPTCVRYKIATVGVRELMRNHVDILPIPTHHIRGTVCVDRIFLFLVLSSLSAKDVDEASYHTTIREAGWKYQ